MITLYILQKYKIDEERPNYYWGKYLFYFSNKKEFYRPKFDNIVNYKKDKGHLLHYIEKLDRRLFNYFFNKTQKRKRQT